MKAGFKPVKFTKAEWQKNRSPAAKASGVGKALDKWQSLYTASLSTQSIKQLTAITAMIKEIEKALEAAKKKCDAKKQKETIAGIGEYLKIVTAYKASVLRAILVLNNREDYKESIDGLKALESDKKLWAVYGTFAKNSTSQFYPAYDTYNLLKKKKVVEAVKKYGNKGKADNLYNLYTTVKKRPLNDVLYSHYILKNDEDPKLVKRAYQALERLVWNDVGEVAFIKAFVASKYFAEHLESEFKVPDHK